MVTRLRCLYCGVRDWWEARAAAEGRSRLDERSWTSLDGRSKTVELGESCRSELERECLATTEETAGGNRDGDGEEKHRCVADRPYQMDDDAAPEWVAAREGTLRLVGAEATERTGWTWHRICRLVEVDQLVW